MSKPFPGLATISLGLVGADTFGHCPGCGFEPSKATFSGLLSTIAGASIISK